MEREIFRSHDGLVVRGLAGGAVRFVCIGMGATLTPYEMMTLAEALRAWLPRAAADDHLERLARLSTAAIG